MNPPELEKPRVTEILVRMDCNGCVQKIKKALHGINGIYDIYIDFPQQKLTVIGWADPERIVKAIRRSRKTATICSHSETTEQAAQPPDPASEGAQPPTEVANPPPEAPPAEAAPPAEQSKDPSPPEHPPPEAAPPHPAADVTANQPGQPTGSNNVEEVHVIYHHPPDDSYRYSYGPSVQGYGGQGSSYMNGPGIRHEQPPPIYVAHSYNTYKPSPYVTEYVTPPPQYSHHSRPEPPQPLHYSRPGPPQPMSYSRSEPSQQPMHYSRPEPPQPMSYTRPEPPQPMHYSRPETPQPIHYNKLEPSQMHYSRSEPPHVNYSRPEPSKYMNYSRQDPPQYSYYSRPEPHQYTYYSRPEQYSDDYRNGTNGNGNITSVFSDENPNACNIV